MKLAQNRGFGISATGLAGCATTVLVTVAISASDL
jgi:hypothetical protein